MVASLACLVVMVVASLVCQVSVVVFLACLDFLAWAMACRWSVGCWAPNLVCSTRVF